MSNLEVLNVGVYREPQQFTQQLDQHFLMFSVQGLKYLKAGFAEYHVPDPHFWLFFPGETFSFEYGPGRENWVISFESDMLLPHLANHQAMIFNDGDWIPFSRFANVPAELVAGWQEEFFQIRDAVANPTPLNLLRAKMGAMAVLRFMIEQGVKVQRQSPANRLRQLISETTNLPRSLAELSVECGYSVDHMRELFTSEFGISPQAYRIRHRMAKAMDLIANSRLSLKEIAYATGFKHPSHFSALFRKTYGASARETMRRLRFGIGATTLNDR